MEGVCWKKKMSARQSQGKVAKVKMQKEHLLVFGRRPVSSIPSFIRVELCFSESPPTPSSSLVAVSFHKLQDVGEQNFGKSSRKFILQGR